MRGKRQGKAVSYNYFSVLIAMSNISLFACGSIHQGHERFSNVSRGKQCAFMSLSALSSGRVFPVQQWTSKTVDNILLKGDRTYLNALIHVDGDIPDEESMSVNNLPTIACW